MKLWYIVKPDARVACHAYTFPSMYNIPKSKRIPSITTCLYSAAETGRRPAGCCCCTPATTGCREFSGGTDGSRASGRPTCTRGWRAPATNRRRCPSAPPRRVLSRNDNTRSLPPTTMKRTRQPDTSSSSLPASAPAAVASNEYSLLEKRPHFPRNEVDRRRIVYSSPVCLAVGDAAVAW